MNYLKLLNQLSVLPVFIAAAVAAVYYKRLPKEIKEFSYFIFVSAAIQAASSALWYQKKNNLFLLHLYVSAGFWTLSWFYESILDGFIHRKIIRTATVTFLVFSVLNSVFLQPFSTFNSYALTMESILVDILALTTFTVMMNDTVRQKWQQIASSITWINSGLFIYYTSSLAIFQLQPYFDHDRSFQLFSKEFNLQAWMLHAFFTLIMYGCASIGLWKARMPSSSP
jgi:hypothetical protein